VENLKINRFAEAVIFGGTATWCGRILLEQ
jgi:hypothetical protein